MILAIRLYGDPVLRKQSRPVSQFDESLRTLAEDMFETMYHHNGVGLAAPQVGVAKRLFVALEIEKSDDEPADLPPPTTREEKRERWGVVAEHVIINPVIEQETGVVADIEGCLSIPGLFVEDVARFETLHLSYQGLSGERLQLSASGHFARVIQHETDHLDGKLFVDRLPDEQRHSFIEEHRKTLADMQREAKLLLKDLQATKVR